MSVTILKFLFFYIWWFRMSFEIDFEESILQTVGDIELPQLAESEAFWTKNGAAGTYPCC